MKANSGDRELLRQFLLGNCSEVEREQVEERLLTDDDYFEQFELVKEEVIDEYAEEEMSTEERESFERHFLTTPDRRLSLRIAQSFIDPTALKQKKKEVPTPRTDWLAWFRPLFAAPLRAGASIAVVAVVALIAWNIFRPDPSLNQGLQALNDAYREQRPIEARVSGIQHAPWSNTRGDEEIKFDRTARARAEALLHVAASKDPDAAAHHALGKLALMNRQFDDAISELNEALKTDPGNAQIHSDLGAAFLERGQLQLQNGDEAASFESFGQSQNHLSRALELEPSLLEAVFNRALVRQQLKLHRLAEEDWKAYLEKDQNSPWADEAQRKLKALGELTIIRTANPDEPLNNFLAAYETTNDQQSWTVLTRSRDYKGNLIENKLLDQYLSAATNGDAESAKQKLALLTYSAELGTRHGDRFASDLVNYYRGTSPNQKTALFEARAIVNSAHSRLIADETSAALSLYAQAATIFDQNGNSCEALLSKYTSAHAHLLQGESELSLSEFEYVRREAEAKRYRWLTGQTLNALANVHIGLNNYSLALELSNESIKLLEEIGDTVGVVKVNDQLGAEYLRLGNPREALRFHHRAVALATENHLGVGPLWRSFFLAAMPFNTLGLAATAIDFTKESLLWAESNKEGFLSVSRSCSHLGVMYGGSGHFDKAMSYFQRAVDSGNQVKTERVRLNALGYASLQMGNLYKLSGDFNRALEKYDEAIRLFDQLKFGAFSYVAHKGKFLACVSQTTPCPSIEQELQTAVDLYEAHRSKIIETNNRYSFFDSEQNVFDVATDYEFSNKNDKEKAFYYVERSRARSLLDPAFAAGPNGHHAANAEPDTVETIKNEIPPETQIVQYAVLDDKLLIWFVSAGRRFEGLTQSVSAEALNEKVGAYLHLLARRSPSDEALRRAATELYDLLLKPVEVYLEKDKLLCIVPDKILNRLPYTSLVSSASGNYLIEDYALTYAPSSTIFIRWSKLARDRHEPRAERLLSVGDPRFDNEAFPSFRYLPAANVEARQIAKEYDSPEVMVSGDATEERVVRAMQKSDIIHLAAHAIVDGNSPMYSKLLLAKQPGGVPVSHNNDGVLMASEIYQLNLPRTRLVILSACQTGAEQYYGGEGMVGLWSPFISLNVPLVVASLWAVDSDSTKELMINFHKLRRSGLSSATALRQAQTRMLHDADKTYQHPYHWASFIAIGGYTQF